MKNIDTLIKKAVKEEDRNYCKCINPIFEHQSTQDEYLGFRCVVCGGELREIKLTIGDKIFLFLLFGTPLGIMLWVILSSY
jgi:transcription initiation factor IIE alpha subunit